MKKIGFTIGKFAPFHKGHEYLIETALKDVDDFYVVIYDTPQFDIDIDTKEKWVKKKFPEVKVIKAFDSPTPSGLWAAPGQSPTGQAGCTGRCARR